MGLLSFLSPPSISVEEAHERFVRGGVFVLDVRERREWRAGHVPGSTNIPLANLASHVQDLPAERTVVAVCRSGARSRSATAQLRRAGFDVLNLKGGLQAWQRAGLPLEPRNGKVAR